MDFFPYLLEGVGNGGPHSCRPPACAPPAPRISARVHVISKGAERVSEQSGGDPGRVANRTENGEGPSPAADPHRSPPRPKPTPSPPRVALASRLTPRAPLLLASQLPAQPPQLGKTNPGWGSTGPAGGSGPPPTSAALGRGIYEEGARGFGLCASCWRKGTRKVLGKVRESLFLPPRRHPLAVPRFAYCIYLGQEENRW